MSVWSLTYEQSVYKRSQSEKTFIRDVPTRWRQKSTGVDMEQNYVTVTLFITGCMHAHRLTLLVGRQEEYPACKNWVMRCWCGYLSGGRWRLFAYGPADATAIPKPHYQHPLPPLPNYESCFRRDTKRRHSHAAAAAAVCQMRGRAIGVDMETRRDGRSVGVASRPRPPTSTPAQPPAHPRPLPCSSAEFRSRRYRGRWIADA